jgi:transposase
VLRFLPDLRIPPTSNQAERDMRPGQDPAEDLWQAPLRAGHRHRYAIRGYISTAAKHGMSVSTVLRDAMPAIPGCRPSQPGLEPAARSYATQADITYQQT